jgi:hypothetical protein
MESVTIQPLNPDGTCPVCNPAPVPEMDDRAKIQNALHLIKLHITEARTEQNQDLHNAVGFIVDVARAHGILDRS